GAAEGVDRQLVARRLGAFDEHEGEEVHNGADARTVTRGQELDVVVALCAVDDDRVGLAVVAAGGVVEIQVDRGKAAAGQAVHDDGVGATQGVDIDHLEVVEVHRDAVDVAGKPDQAAVGRDTEVFRGVRAIEYHRVGALLPVDGVAAVAGV